MAIDEARRAYARYRAQQLKLTAKQVEIAALIASGLSNRDAAKVLGVSEKTIKFHSSNIYQVSGFRTRLELALHLVDGYRGGTAPLARGDGEC